ncbi:MAG TPA: helix-turn-helix domain-containing protein [Chloroflexota bacterium]
MATALHSLHEGDAYRLLIEQVIAGNGLSGVIRELAEMLGAPATVTDEDLTPLWTFAPGGRHLPAEKGVIDPELRHAIAFDLVDQPQASTSPPTIRLDRENLSYVVAPVVLPVGVVGYVWSAASPSSYVDEMVSHAAAACALEVVKQRAIIEGENRVRNSFLEDLLAGNVRSTSAMRRRARYLGYELRGEQTVFVLDIDDFSTYIARHSLDEAGIQRLKERFRRSVDSCLPGVWSRALVWEHSDAMVVLVPAGKDRQTQSFRARVETLRSAVEKRLAGPTISAGIGRGYADLTRLQHSYHEAEHALRIGVAVSGHSGTGAFEDLGAYRLLFHLRDQPELSAFCEETIGALERYDEEHQGHLVDTLESFLSLQGNLSQTARDLHLHRNGLLYRLARIEKIADCDLNNPSQRLALQLALLARPLLRHKNRSPATIA